MCISLFSQQKKIAIYTFTVDNPKVIPLLFCKMTKEKKKIKCL